MTGRGVINKVLGVICGLVFFGAGIYEYISVSHLRSSGHQAIVQPIDKYEKRSSRGIDTYYAQFKFKTEAGNEISMRKEFPEELLKDFSSNTPVKIFYNPKDPTEFAFEKGGPSWILIGGGLAVAIGALIFV